MDSKVCKVLEAMKVGERVNLVLDDGRNQEGIVGGYDAETKVITLGIIGSNEKVNIEAQNVVGVNVLEYSTKVHGGVSVFAGVGERRPEGNDIYNEVQDAGVISSNKDVE